VLTEVKAYSSWQSAPTLILDDNGRAETDLIQIRNITGLDPVKASVNTAPFGSIDGAAYTGSSVLGRNIVLTLHPNPDWDKWTYESLRRLLYSYFIPKRPVKLVFYSDDIDPVQIEGIVESAEVNPFTNDPEFVVSIVCPDPYFTALDPVILTGQAIRSGGTVTTVDYKGNIDTGIYVKVTRNADPAPSSIGIQIGDPSIQRFNVTTDVTATKYFEMGSIRMQKFVQSIDMNSGVITNLLSKVQEGSSWPILEPGENDFSVITNQGGQDWELTYYERFGGL